VRPVASLPKLPDGIHAYFDHAAHAAPSARDLLPLYQDILGGRFVYGGANPRVGYRAFVLEYAGGGKIELMEPLPGSSFLDSFFARNPRGGLHHLTFKVRDLRQTMARARDAGYALIGAYLDDEHWREVFVHPRSGNGALIQFVEPDPFGYPGRGSGGSVEEVLQDGA